MRLTRGCIPLSLPSSLPSKGTERNGRDGGGMGKGWGRDEGGGAMCTWIMRATALAPSLVRLQAERFSRDMLLLLLMESDRTERRGRVRLLLRLP